MTVNWENAPEGATHYAAAEGVWYACFYKDDFKQVWVCDDESEQWYAQWPSLAKGRSVIPRPTSTAIPQTAEQEIERLRAEVERLKVGHDRYEILRKLNVVQFQALYTKAPQSHLPFDELVDMLGVQS